MPMYLIRGADVNTGVSMVQGTSTASPLCDDDPDILFGYDPDNFIDLVFSLSPYMLTVMMMMPR